jgi:fatty-acyl-CoA synthase
MIYGDWIGRWGRAYPHKEALVDLIENKRYTYAQLADDVHRMSHFLMELGVRKGDRVAVLSMNRSVYIKLFFATSRLGAILVPLNFRLARDEYLYFLKDCTPRVLFFDEVHQTIIADIKTKAGVDHYVCFDADESVGQSLKNTLSDLSTAPPPEVDIQAEDPQLIIYTSGTTGLPKGVIQSHGMLTWNAINTNIGWDLRSDDRTVLHAALFYTAGWNVFTLPIFHCRGTNILIKSFDADLILDLIENEHVSVFFGVPAMFQMMMASPKFKNIDFSSIRFMVSGGAPLPKTVADTYQEQHGIRLWEGYGLTEVGPNNFLANGELGSVGQPMFHVDVKAVDDDGNQVPAGEDGELLLRGDHMCSGYWNKPSETQAAFKHGWFATGDLARIDADGHLSIVGRKKDMLISGGINIYPAEIERIIDMHPQIESSAVIGVPDDRWGEVGKAIVELKGSQRLTLEDLQAYLKERLGKYKIPKFLVVVDELPRTAASGKIQKFILKDEHGQADNS